MNNSIVSASAIEYIVELGSPPREKGVHINRYLTVYEISSYTISTKANYRESEYVVVYD